MFVVTGANGSTGAAVVESLLEQKQPVRVVVREAAKGEVWRSRGCEVVVADLKDPVSLSQAFRGAQGAYILNPPAYQSDDMFQDAREVTAAVRDASTHSGLPRLVVLSSVGAHLPERTGNIFTTHILEEELQSAAPQMVFVRCAWFMDNWQPLLPVAREPGVLPSFLLPLDRAIPMIATRDIGHTCAQALTENESGIIELHSPRDYSSHDVASALGVALHKDVQAVEIPREGWAEAMAPMQLSAHAQATWIEMLEGFNSGYIVFEGGHDERRGSVTLKEVAREWTA